MKQITAAMLSAWLLIGIAPPDPSAGAKPVFTDSVTTSGTVEVPAPPRGAQEGDWYAVGPTETALLGDEIDLDKNGSFATLSPAEKSTAQPLLNPVSIGYCNIGRSTHVIEKFASKFDGTISLRCGHSGGGYIHIRADHRSHWQGSMTGPGLWDDFMVYAVREALKAPSTTQIRTTNNSRCYKTPIKMYRLVNGRPQYVKTMYPRVAVSMNNAVVITAFPTTDTKC